jgi:hypothetical protein
LSKVYQNAKDVSWEICDKKEVQPIAKTQTFIIDLNVVDVSVTTKSKAIEQHVFKDRKPRKAKNATN